MGERSRDRFARRRRAKDRLHEVGNAKESETISGPALRAVSNANFSQQLCGGSWPVLPQTATARVRRGAVAQASACVVIIIPGRRTPHRLKPVLPKTFIRRGTIRHSKLTSESRSTMHL